MDELFERDGRFIGSGEIINNLDLNGKEGTTPIFNFIFWHKNGRLYGNAFYQYSPIVRVARLEYKITN